MHARLLLGSAAFALALHAGRAGPPPDWLHWRRYAEPAFPLELSSTLVHEGFATLVFTFDAEGKITDRIVVAASHPAFVAAVYQAVREWEVDTRDLAHSLHRDTIRFDFERRRAIVSMSQRDAAKAAFTPYGDHPGSPLRTLHEEEVRGGLQTTVAAMPAYPPVLSERHVRGSATVSFVVDVSGTVRVPAVTDASEPAFGEEALGAVRSWRFTPPRQGGAPVQVIAERTFRFGPPREKAGEK